MGFDVAAVERLSREVSRVFAEGVQSLALEAVKEAEQTRQRLDDEARALAKGQAKLEEAWRQLNVERHRVAMATGASLGAASSWRPAAASSAPEAALGALRYDTPPRARPGRGGSPEKPMEKASVSKKPSKGRAAAASALPASSGTAALPYDGSAAGLDAKVQVAGWGQVELAPQAVDPWNYVPADCQVTLKGHAYTVLPVQSPEAASMGHDLWNHVVEVPEGWEVLSTGSSDFKDIIATLTQHRWGSLVLGVRGSQQSFDAYWTPLFGDGCHAGQLCQEDVDWIEPIEGSSTRFRMTYSGLRLVMRRPSAAPMAAEHGR